MDKKEEDFKTMAYSIIANPDEPVAQGLMLDFMKQYYPNEKMNLPSTLCGFPEDS